MNTVILMGRLTRDPDIRYTNADPALCVARYSIAVDRPGKEKAADFINCVAFGKAGEFAEKWLHKGMKIAVIGRIQTGSYTDKEGVKRNSFDVIVNQHEFCESAKQEAAPEETKESAVGDGFMDVPDGVDDEFLPFN